MTATTGIILAFGALISWGFGDFFIQRSVRAVGTMKTFLIIGSFASIILFPFAYQGLVPAFSHASTTILLLLLCTVAVVSAFLNLEAFRRGKLAVVEPVMGAELPITVALGIFIGREQLTAIQLVLIAAVFLGIVLAAHRGRFRIEKGVSYAAVGALAMGLSNFLVGTASRETSAALTLWAVYTSLALVSLVYLSHRRSLGEVGAQIKKHRTSLAGACLFDTSAWICYGLATTLIPISVAITVSESYIALAAVLGIVVNRERLRPRQLIGAGLAIAGAITLAAITA